MKSERTKVDFPMWRKKADSSLFKYKGTTIPGWACGMWGIQEDFSDCNSKKKEESRVKILFSNVEYEGWVTVSKQKRKTPPYRLWFSDDLKYNIKHTFVMSYMRDIEYRLRNDKRIDIENEIPFWEFLDIEYDRENKTFYFTAYYTQKPSFPELFKRLIGAPAIDKIDDELNNKDEFRIYKQDWKPREELDSELEVENVLYTLINTKAKLIYIGEASKLVKRVKQPHPSIKGWDYYRYDVLPKQISNYRVALERMLIRHFACLLENKKGIDFIQISDYKLANDKIDK